MTTGEDELAQALAVTPDPVLSIFDARITKCLVTYDSVTGVWTVEAVSVRPLNTTEEIPAGWSSAWEADVTAAQGRNLAGLLVEVHSVNGRPRVAYTVRG